MLRLRLIYGLSLAALIVGLLALDGFLATRIPVGWNVPGLGADLTRWLLNGALSTAVVAAMVWLSAHELVRFAWSTGYRPHRLLTQCGAIGVVIGPFIAFNWPGAGRPGEAWAMFLVATVLGLAFLYQALRHRTDKAMVNVACTMFIILYTGGLGHFMTRLRMEVGGADGIVLLLFSMAVVKMTDVGAYFTGRLVGRTKLIPWLSPKKTWEGFVGGIIVAALCTLGLGYSLRACGVGPLQGGGIVYVLALLVFGLVMAGFSVAGDLCASLLKRDAAVKDSSEVLPGLGGVLDVLDSPLAAAPIAWLFWTRLFQVGSAA